MSNSLRSHGLHLLGEVSFVLGLHIHTPENGILKLVSALLELFDRLGVADASEIARDQRVESLQKTVVYKLIEKLQLTRAVFHNVANDVLDHRLGGIHVVTQVGKSHLRLDHPELGGVALGVGVLGAEGGAKGVDVTEGHGEVLGVELAGNGQVGGLAEEVLAPVDAAVLQTVTV